MNRTGESINSSTHHPMTHQSPHVLSIAANASPSDRPRFLSEADCHNIAARLGRFAQGGGYTTVEIASTWTGNVRWVRNQISTSGDVRDNTIGVTRDMNGATSRSMVLLNDTSDSALVAAARRAERMARCRHEEPQGDLTTRYQSETFTAPAIFSEATYQLDADHRAEAARKLAQSAADAGMLSAGYIEVSAHSLALIDTLGRSWYFPYTQAQYSVTVRDPKGTGSGWAGVDWHDWSKIDGEKLSAIALDKCLRSRNPVAIEPGRYTVILEPQAVCDFVAPLIGGAGTPLDRPSAEYLSSFPNPWRKTDPGTGSTEAGYSQLGDRVMDERITISSDPMDPELGFPPFELWGDSFENRKNMFSRSVFHPVTWIENGVLKNLAYDRDFGREFLHVNTGLPASGAFRMSGGTTSIDEMIATTTRGLLVTRFDGVQVVDLASQLQRGHTRDGLWLIEKGKISKPVKNLTFTESILFALNSVEQLGVPQRVFHPRLPIYMLQPQPVIVPPLKIRDFSFTALDDAI